jgi:hypothetical protein
MSQTALIQSLRAARVVPVVRMESAVHAETAVEWLRGAGIRIFGGHGLSSLLGSTRRWLSPADRRVRR